MAALLAPHPRDRWPSAADLAAEPTHRLAAAHEECAAAQRDVRTRHALVCFAVDEALVSRRRDFQHREYLRWFRYEAWGLTLVGTCADAHRSTERLPTLLGPVDLPDGRLPGWRAFADSGSFHREIDGRYLLEHVLVHARALLSCEDGEGLHRVLELVRDDLRPLLVSGLPYVPDGAEPPTIAALVAELGSTDPHAARAVVESGALPAAWAHALGSAGAPAACPSAPQAIETMLMATDAPTRIEGCACVRRLDDRDPAAPSLHALRHQLATFDAWTESQPLGRGSSPVIPDGAGPLVTGLAGLGVLSSALRPSTTDLERHDVRTACAPSPTLAGLTPPEPSVRIIRVRPEQHTIEVLALVPGGLHYQSSVVVWSAAADGTPDGRYCQRSDGPAERRGEIPLPGFEGCPRDAPAASLGITPLDGAGLPTHAGPSTTVVLERVKVPADVPRVSVSVSLGEELHVIHSPAHPMPDPS